MDAMEKWKLNVELLKNIFEVCGRPNKRVLKRLGIKYSTWMTWMSVEAGKMENTKPEQGGVLVTALLAVCNELRVPVRKLFYKEGEVAVIPLSQDLVCQRGRFILCRFDQETFQTSFGIRSKAEKSIERMMKEMGYSFHVYSVWMRMNPALRVAQLIRFCEVFGYDLFSFLVDNNKVFDEESEEESSVMTDEEEKEKTQKDIVSLRERNSKLSRQFKESREEVKKLNAELFDLKVRNNELENEVVRLKQYIDSIELGSHGLVADNGVQGWGKKDGSGEQLV